MLTSKQCDAFMEEHGDIVVGAYGCRRESWYIYDRGDNSMVDLMQCQSSREAAITAYWQKYHKEWTPPVEDTEPRSDIHDAEWVLEYMIEHDLGISVSSDSKKRHCFTTTTSNVSKSRNVRTIKDFVFLIRNWQAEYDKHEETELELLNELSQMLKGIDHSKIQSIIARIRNLLSKNWVCSFPPKEK